MKILIVEDDTHIRYILREMLELNGHEVLAAADGIEAVELLVHRPFFIFSDINMPRMNGFELRERLREMPEFARLPFVFLSAQSDRFFVKKAAELEADACLCKPFTMQDLLSVIRANAEKGGYPPCLDC